MRLELSEVGNGTIVLSVVAMEDGSAPIRTQLTELLIVKTLWMGVIANMDRTAETRILMIDGPHLTTIEIIRTDLHDHDPHIALCLVLGLPKHGMSVMLASALLLLKARLPSYLYLTLLRTL